VLVSQIPWVLVASSLVRRSWALDKRKSNPVKENGSLVKSDTTKDVLVCLSVPENSPVVSTLKPLDDQKSRGRSVLTLAERGLLAENKPKQTTKLEVELVPRSCWFTNVRSSISKEDWDKIRKAQAEQAGNRCQICRGKGPKWPVECHETWEYNEEIKIQRLKGLISLCPDCHRVKHFGKAQIDGKDGIAFAWLMKVNGWDRNQAEKHIEEAFRIWQHRSQIIWELDISFLDSLGIKIINQQSLEERANTSEKMIAR
jgi:5-methylcytosine-specific restriction endonuclease McrA